MISSTFSQLLFITLFLFTDASFGGTCGYMSSSYPAIKVGDLILHDVPEDDALWLKDRAYLTDEERKKEIDEAVKIQNSVWVDKNRRGELSRFEEDKILAAYLARKSISEFREKISAAKRSIEQLEKRKGVSLNEISKIKSQVEFMTIKYILWPNVKFPEYEKNRADFENLLKSMQGKLESSQKK